MQSGLKLVGQIGRTGIVASLLVLGASSSWVQEPPYEILAQRDVMVPMRDGTKLATDIYLPARGGVAITDPVPVVFSRTPYGKGTY